MSTFDPNFDSQRQMSGDKLTNLTVKSSEPLILVAAGASPNVPSGYRKVEISSDGNLLVFGDVVRIVGALNLPGRAVKINARVLQIAVGQDGKEAPSISVSGGPCAEPAAAEVVNSGSPGDGTPGKYTYRLFVDDIYEAPTAGTSGAPGDDGAPGNPGLPAGWVDIRAGSLVQIGGAVLTIEANSGTGGRGQDGQPGQHGGNGGDGADAWAGVIDLEKATDGADAGAGAPGGRGGPGGYGGSAGLIKVQILEDFAAGAIRTSSVKGGKGMDGMSGADGKNGEPGKGGRPTSYTQPDGLVGIEEIPGGNLGGYAKPKDLPAPAPVVADTSEDKQAIVIGKAQPSEVALTVDGDQLAMLLDTVRTGYVGLDNTNLDDTADDPKQWLADQLRWLASVCSAAPTSVTLPAGMKYAVSGMLRNLMDPMLDAFGHSCDLVPLASLSAYEGLMSGSVSLLKETEKAWSDYRDARNQGNELASARTAALNDVANRITALTSQFKEAWKQLATLSADISGMATGPLKDAKDDVLAKMTSFVKNVKSKINLSFDKYLEVIEQTAFAMSDPVQGAIVFGTEEVKFWKSAISDVTGVDGQTVSKSYLTSRIDILGKNITGPDEAYSVINGYIQLQDQDAYKLLCTQEKLDDLLDNYTTVDGAGDAEDAMKTYVGLVLQRNGKIMDYNAQVNLIAQLKEAIDQLTHDHSRLEADASGSLLPIMDRFVQGLYDRAKLQCINDLYELSKAYRFWSLRDYNVFADVLACADPSTINAVAIDAGCQRIKTLNIDDVNTLMTDLENRVMPVVWTFKATPAMIRAFSKDRGCNEQGEEEAHFWEFNMEPATMGTQAKNDLKGQFADMANVRLAEVRCWLIGLDSAANTTGAVKVHLTQQGDESLTMRNNSLVSVRHAPVENTFEYSTTGPWPSDAAVLTKATYGGSTTPRKLPHYTPIGPFARWRIGVRTQNAAKSIHWEKLESIRLEFYISYQGFETSSHPVDDLPGGSSTAAMLS